MRLLPAQPPKEKKTRPHFSSETGCDRLPKCYSSLGITSGGLILLEDDFAHYEPSNLYAMPLNNNN